MEDEKFWVIVKTLMVATGTTQEALAISCQIPLSTLKGWIKSNYYPTIIEGYRIAKVFGVSVEYLITGEKHPVPIKADQTRSLLYRAEEKRVNLFG